MSEVRPLPVYVIPTTKDLYILNEYWDVVCVTDKLEEYNGHHCVVYRADDEAILSLPHIWDASFFQFIIIDSTKRNEEFTHELDLIHSIKHLVGTTDLLQIKQILLKLKELTYSQKFCQTMQRYHDYYEKMVRPILKNTLHFNQQRLYVDPAKLEQSGLLSPTSLRFDNERCFIPIHIEPYNWSTTGRLNAAIFSDISKIKPCLEPNHSAIMEIDCTAAEWNFLTYVTGEDTLYQFGKKTYWSEFQDLLGCSLLTKGHFKQALYMTLYGAKVSTIATDLGISEEQVTAFREGLRERFPKTYLFSRLQKNDYISKDSSIIYDFFGKEIYVEENYKKLNYFLQSSLSTYFQVEVSKIIEGLKRKKCSSTILFTIHDSLFLDLKASEKTEVLELIKKTNDTSALKLSIKNVINLQNNK